MNKIFISFLNSLKPYNTNLIESIIQGYQIIYESSENEVKRIKDALGNVESNNPLDDKSIPSDNNNEQSNDNDIKESSLDSNTNTTIPQKN